MHCPTSLDDDAKILKAAAALWTIVGRGVEEEAGGKECAKAGAIPRAVDEVKTWLPAVAARGEVPT